MIFVVCCFAGLSDLLGGLYSAQDRVYSITPDTGTYQKQKSINSVAKQLSDVIKLNDKIKLPVNKLNTLVSNAKNLDNLIKNNIKNHKKQ